MDLISKKEANSLSTKSLKQSLLEESYAMVTYLAANGHKVPENTNTILNATLASLATLEIEESEVISIHNTLSKKVAPARPRTLWLTLEESHKGKTYKLFSSVGLIRRMMITAIASLTCFILLSLSGKINSSTVDNTIFNSDGIELFIVLMFLISSAALGAVFGNLFQANKYIVENTFDPKYESSYWIRFVLGIIAGFLLAILIPIPAVGNTETSTNMQVFSKPLLAMLGGFSSSLVYRILFRIVFALESMFVGKKDDAIEEEKAKMQAETELELEKERQKHNSKLNKLQGVVNSKQDTSTMKDTLNTAIENAKTTSE